LGVRLRPLTAVTNKHLLPVYNQPMIFYPVQTLVNAGITDIMIVTGGNSAGDFLKLLGNGKAFGLKHLNYTYQEGEGGIAAALSLVEHFAAGEPVCVVLGDNIIQGNIRAAADSYRQQDKGANHRRCVSGCRRFRWALGGGRDHRRDGREDGEEADRLCAREPRAGDTPGAGARG